MKCQTNSSKMLVSNLVSYPEKETLGKQLERGKRYSDFIIFFLLII